MQPQRDLAIVLRSIPYQERHRIVTALTEGHGQVTALARNSIQSRRFGGTLDLFAAAEWQFVERPGAEFWNLREAQIRRAFEGIRKDFERLSLASVFNELMLKIAPRHEACPELFRLHSNALAALDEADESSFAAGSEVALLNAYLAKLLQWNGSQPRIDCCLSCGATIDRFTAGDSSSEKMTCRISEAGWNCPACRTAQTSHLKDGQGIRDALLRISRDAIVDFQICLMMPIRQVPKAVQAKRADHLELFQFLEALLIYHVPGFDRQPLKGLRFLSFRAESPPV